MFISFMFFFVPLLLQTDLVAFCSEGCHLGKKKSARKDNIHIFRKSAMCFGTKKEGGGGIHCCHGNCKVMVVYMCVFDEGEKRCIAQSLTHRKSYSGEVLTVTVHVSSG